MNQRILCEEESIRDELGREKIKNDVYLKLLHFILVSGGLSVHNIIIYNKSIIIFILPLPFQISLLKCMINFHNENLYI